MTMTIIVTATALALGALVAWLRQDTAKGCSYTYRRHEAIREWIDLHTVLTAYGRRRRKHHCADSKERGGCARMDLPHRPCEKCGGMTPSKELRIEPGTLRRRYVYTCSNCWGLACGQRSPEQDALRKQRAFADWERPIPDQYPGPARTFVRDFLDSDDQERVLGAEDPDVVTVNGVLGALGLTGTAYAEQRSNQTVVRKL